jgi:hypothetical protein
MWNRYRKWKPTLGLLLTAAALLLMTGQPDASTRWYFGIGIATVLILAYVAEEIVWMARNQGRPCSKCGRALRVKPFRLHLRCPHCGEMQ